MTGDAFTELIEHLRSQDDPAAQVLALAVSTFGEDDEQVRDAVGRLLGAPETAGRAA